MPPLHMTPAITHVRVRDCMHPGIFSCSGDAPLGEIAGIMAKHRVHAVAVTSAEGKRVAGGRLGSRRRRSRGERQGTDRQLR